MQLKLLNFSRRFRHFNVFIQEAKLTNYGKSCYKFAVIKDPMLATSIVTKVLQQIIRKVCQPLYLVYLSNMHDDDAVVNEEATHINKCPTNQTYMHASMTGYITITFFQN